MTRYALLVRNRSAAESWTNYLHEVLGCPLEDVAVRITDQPKALEAGLIEFNILARWLTDLTYGPSFG